MLQTWKNEGERHKYARMLAPVWTTLVDYCTLASGHSLIKPHITMLHTMCNIAKKKQVSGSLCSLDLSLSPTPHPTHTHTPHTQYAKSCSLNCKAAELSLRRPFFSVVIRISCRAEQSSASSTAGLELQGHTEELKPPPSTPLRWTTLYPDLQDKEWVCSEGIGHSSQRPENYSIWNKSLYVCLLMMPKTQCQDLSVHQMCSLIMKERAISQIIKAYTQTTHYLLTGQTNKKVSGLLGSQPQTNWVFTHTFNITNLWLLVPGWTGWEIIESWLASESMTQNQEGNQEHFHTVCMRELVGTWDRSERVSGPAQGPGSGVGWKRRGGRERVKSLLPWLMLQSSCPPHYNNTGSTKTGSTKLQPKSSDALTQKIPSPPRAA